MLPQFLKDVLTAIGLTLGIVAPWAYQLRMK